MIHSGEFVLFNLICKEDPDGSVGQTDTPLYQLSAIILGREINHSRQLRTVIRDYSQQRGHPNQPVQLNGHRSRRRLLLARCASIAFDPFGRLIELCRQGISEWELAEIGDVEGVLFAFVFGVAGTFLYVWHDLHKSTVHLRNDPFQRVSSVGRVSLFLIMTFIYTALMVTLFWFMFSSTDQVVHGSNTPLHLLSWTGFALFVGVFLGLIDRFD